MEIDSVSKQKKGLGLIMIPGTLITEVEIRKISIMGSFIIALQIISTIIVIASYSGGGTPGRFFAVPLVAIAILYFTFRQIKDNYWQFGLLFVACTTVVEHFSKMAAHDRSDEGIFIAVICFILLFFAGFCLFKFFRSPKVKVFYQKKTQVGRVLAGTIAYLALFVASLFINSML